MPLRAFSLGKAETVMEAAVYANNSILASPPLPLLDFKKGASQLSLVAAHYTIEIDEPTEADPDSIPSGDFKGNGASLNYSSAFNKNWGYFVFVTYNGLTGDFTNTTDSGNVVSTASDAEASFYAVGTGLMYNLVNTKFLTIPIFFGPLIGQMNFSAKIQQTSGGSLNSDFDMESMPLMVGGILGIQVALKLSDYLAVIPYAIVGGDFTDSCKEWEVTESRVEGPVSTESSRECGGTFDGSESSSTNQIYLSNSIMAYGVNVAIPRWGVTVGVVSGFSVDPDSENIKLTKIQLGLSF